MWKVGCSQLELALSSKAGTELLVFVFSDQTKEYLLAVLRAIDDRQAVV